MLQSIGSQSRTQFSRTLNIRSSIPSDQRGLLCFSAMRPWWTQPWGDLALPILHSQRPLQDLVLDITLFYLNPLIPYFQDMASSPDLDFPISAAFSEPLCFTLGSFYFFELLIFFFWVPSFHWVCPCLIFSWLSNFRCVPCPESQTRFSATHTWVWMLSITSSPPRPPGFPLPGTGIYGLLMNSGSVTLFALFLSF